MIGDRKPWYLSCLIVYGCLICGGCAWFQTRPQQEIPMVERPYVAVLPFGIEVEITKLSYIKSVEEDLSPEDEAQQLADALQQIRTEARRLLQSRLATGQRFRFVADEQVAAAMTTLELKPGVVPTTDQLAYLRAQVGADLVIVGNILDYGKIRWQYWVPGLVVSMLTETLIVGAATGFNPAFMAATAGSELLTDVPFWWGGAYIAGWAFRPVRVEASAIDPLDRAVVWDETEAAVYLWGRLKEVPEGERKKKEVQLGLNLKKAMEDIGDSLLDAGLTISVLRSRRLPDQPIVAF
jgi:hypothetical protein